MSNATSAYMQSAHQPVMNDRQDFFRLGMMCSTGVSGSADMVSAHKWFNIAAMRGNAEAARLRREIADEMSEAEIAAAQRAARDWMTRH
jgi:TPR repeat protein